MIMNKSLIPGKSLEAPKELQKFLSNPPLMGTERPEDYMEFFLVIATAARPFDAIGWLLVSDLAAIWWEIRRERLIKAAIIRQKQQEAVAKLGNTRADYEREMRAAAQSALDDDASSLFRLRGSAPIEQKQEDSVSLLAMAYLHGGDEIELCLRRIAALEYRLIAFLNEVERRNQKMARRADSAASDVVDAEFTDPED
jgi:hypothetical protein